MLLRFFAIFLFLVYVSLIYSIKASVQERKRELSQMQHDSQALQTQTHDLKVLWVEAQTPERLTILRERYFPEYSYYTPDRRVHSLTDLPEVSDSLQLYYLPTSQHTLPEPPCFNELDCFLHKYLPKDLLAPTPLKSEDSP